MGAVGELRVEFDGERVGHVPGVRVADMKQVKLIGVAILILVGVAVVIVCWPSNEPFTKEKWINATPQMRDRLMESLARGGILIGLTEKEVYEMLGDPGGSSHGRASTTSAMRAALAPV